MLLSLDNKSNLLHLFKIQTFGLWVNIAFASYWHNFTTRDRPTMTDFKYDIRIRTKLTTYVGCSNDRYLRGRTESNWVNVIGIGYSTDNYPKSYRVSPHSLEIVVKCSQPFSSSKYIHIVSPKQLATITWPTYHPDRFLFIYFTFIQQTTFSNVKVKVITRWHVNTHDLRLGTSLAN